MAYITKRGNKWQARVSWADVQGKIHQKAKSGFLTKTAAKQFAYEWETRKSHNQISDQDPAFANYFWDWYKTYKESKISVSTQRMYLKVHKDLDTYFGQNKIGKIKRGNYQRFINSYGQNHAKVTVEKMNSTIRSCVRDAILDGIIHANFTERVQLVWNNAKTFDVDYLNTKEIKALVDSLKEDINPRYVSRYMIITAIYTGMRLGEILALEWKDIDYNDKTIDINKSYDYIGNRIKKPKTNTSIRIIRVNSELLDLIISQLKKNRQKNVFAQSDGNLISSAAVNHTLRRHLAHCGLHKKAFHFHSLRHSHVALLLSQGVDLYAISKRLGHSNMSITAKTYAYLIDELKVKSDDQIEGILDHLLI